MHIDSPARQREFEAPIGSNKLAEGLMLVRASNLKMIRLQLAMDRNDRRVALEAVDDLVALDRRLQECLANVPAASQQLLFRDALDADRAMLDREKLSLAAEVILRPREAATAEAAEAADDDWLGPRNLPIEVGPRRNRWWFAAIPVLLSALAGGAYVLTEPEAQAWLIAALKALQ